MIRVVVRASMLHYGDGSQELELSCGHSLWVAGVRDHVGDELECAACSVGAPAPATLVHPSILARLPRGLGRACAR